MRNRLLLLILVLVIVGLAMGVSGGCGESYYEEVGYYDPNWLVDGRVMAVKAVTKYKQEGAIPGYSRTIELSHAEYIVAMKDDGTDEKIIYGGEGKGIGIPVASPLGNYIAYRSGQYINIITADGTREVKSIDCGERPNSFDWSPDETRIAYSGDESKDLYVLRVSDEVKTKIASSAESVAWRVGEKIVYTPWTSGFAVISSDGSGFSLLASLEGDYNDTGNDHQITNDGRVIYRGKNWSVLSINLDGTSPMQLFVGYELSTLMLSFDNTKIAGGELEQRAIKGVWVVNIDGSNLRKLRD